MPVPADGWTVLLGMWGTASIAVAGLFAWVMRGAERSAPVRRADQAACECLACLRLRRTG